VASSVLQLFAPVEKTRPFFQSYQPCDIFTFITKFHNYNRRGGPVVKYLCLSAAQLDRIFHPSQVPEFPPNEFVHERLRAQLPNNEMEAGRDYFTSNIAMRINRAGNESLNNYTVTSIVIFGVTTIVS
jgi:hypothetical protein